jgi:hypothetical protein
MATKVSQIKESIELPSVRVGSAPVTIVQRQINLVDRVQHNLMNCEMFMDNILIDTDDEPWRGVVEILVSPYPIIYTDSSISGFPFRSPSASQEGILFKAIINGGSDQFSDIQGAQFPSRFAAFDDEFDFYHPNLYITMMFHSSVAVTLKDIAFSFLFSISQKTTSELTHSLGLLKESFELMTMTISSMGRDIAYANNVGQIAPHWRWGGARPEYMVTANTLMDFWVKNGNNESEESASPAALRFLVKSARQMVENPGAFGTAATGITGDIPDWIAFITQEGYVSGPIRPQWPPLKHYDNGNVEMF